MSRFQGLHHLTTNDPKYLSTTKDNELFYSIQGTHMPKWDPSQFPLPKLSCLQEILHELHSSEFLSVKSLFLDCKVTQQSCFDYLSFFINKPWFWKVWKFSVLQTQYFPLKWLCHMTHQLELPKSFVVLSHFSLSLANFDFHLSLPISCSRKYLQDKYIRMLGRRKYFLNTKPN